MRRYRMKGKICLGVTILLVIVTGAFYANRLENRIVALEGRIASLENPSAKILPLNR
jgi:hypothetical protein